MKRWLPLLLILSAAALQVHSLIDEAQVYDEGLHLVSGYTYLKTGERKLSIENPPFGNVLSALPLLLINPRLPFEHPSWRIREAVDFGREFLYKNRVPAETMLWLGRTVTMLITALGTALIWWWTRRHIGERAALIAATLFAFDPNILAHGRYITTDVMAAVLLFAAIIAWSAFIDRPQWARLLLVGVLTGFAIGTKYSCALLLPLFPAIALARRRPKLLLHSAAVALIAYITLAAVHFPYFRTFFVFSEANPVYEGLKVLREHNRNGHSAYLLGEISQNGRWLFFPVAFLVKTPVATLILLAIASARLPRIWRQPWFFTMAIPAAAYVAMSVASNINIGIRHLLPLYPFLFILAGAALAGLRLRWTASLLALALIETLSVHPHYIAFFNRAVGGPANGSRYLIDSNLDWGQDAIRFKRFLDKNNFTKVCFVYFGQVDLDYYSIPVGFLPPLKPADPAATGCEIAAISATILRGAYVEPGWWAWLRGYRPMTVIGHSIYVYDFRKQPVARPQ